MADEMFDWLVTAANEAERKKREEAQESADPKK